MREALARRIAAITGLLVVGGVLLFAGVRWWTVDDRPSDVDPQRWQKRYPRHYESTMKTQIDYGRTAFGGSQPYDKLEANPFRRRAFAGHPFALDYRAARGHHYAQIDQRTSGRTRAAAQPAACIHCHAAEAPALLAEYGWEEFHRLRYDELQHRLHHGTSCADCHAPETMELRVTRTPFIRGIELRGVDVTKASRQELRTYVCAQCHAEYYFCGTDEQLRFPWQHGLGIDEIEQHYDDLDFSDWLHTETGAPMIKIQHPEFELYSAGNHALHGVSCADCHMPHVQEAGLRISDHWIRSPLTNVKASCLNCHQGTEEGLRARAERIQRRTTELLHLAEGAIGDLMDAISAARQAGADDEALAEALQRHRQAQLRWDFIDAENSTGFHAPLETFRVLAHALEIARQGERHAMSLATSQSNSDSTQP